MMSECKELSLSQRSTNLGQEVTCGTKFCMVISNILAQLLPYFFNLYMKYLWTILHVTLLVPRIWRWFYTLGKLWANGQLYWTNTKYSWPNRSLHNAVSFINMCIFMLYSACMESYMLTKSWFHSSKKVFLHNVTKSSNTALASWP